MVVDNWITIKTSKILQIIPTPNFKVRLVQFSKKNRTKTFQNI